MAMPYSREFVRFICFCIVHSVSVYWHTTSPNGSVGAVVGSGCALSVRERLHSSCSRQSMQSNPFAGSPSLASSCCHKLFNSLARMLKFAQLLGRRLLRWPPVSDPPKAILVSKLFVLSLSLSGPISMSLMSSMMELRSPSSLVCPASPWWVVIVWGFTFSAVWLVPVSNFPEHGLEWWIHPFVTPSCQMQSIYM